MNLKEYTIKSLFLPHPVKDVHGWYHIVPRLCGMIEKLSLMSIVSLLVAKWLELQYLGAPRSQDTWEFLRQVSRTKKPKLSCF